MLVILFLGGLIIVVCNGCFEIVCSSSVDLFLYKIGDYWYFVFVEVGVLFLGEFVGSENLRRVVVCVVVVGVWLIGWVVMFRSVKDWMWE